MFFKNQFPIITRPLCLMNLKTGVHVYEISARLLKKNFFKF